MKFTHNAITSIMVEKVENIYTNFTRAGNGDDMHRRQRERERYANCKQEQEEKQEQIRDEFLKQRQQKVGKYTELTDKRRDKRNKKKERAKQLKNKVKLLKKLNDNNQKPQVDGDEEDSEIDEANIVQ